MKIRSAQFALVPTWVIEREGIRGDATRIAVYVAVRVLAYECPDTDWRSDRELSVALGEIVGIGADACRKHVRALRLLGVITGRSGELFLPSDDLQSGDRGPQTGDGSGDGGPHNGDGGPHNGDGGPHSPIYKKGRKVESSGSGDVGSPGPTAKVNRYAGQCGRCGYHVGSRKGVLVDKVPFHLSEAECRAAAPVARPRGVPAPLQVVTASREDDNPFVPPNKRRSHRGEGVS
jgi:hypothetical protein